VASSPSSRLAYIDWLRGLACVLMFQTHCYDAWLGGVARDSRFAMWSHLMGTFPAPLFLFLAGISVAIVSDKLLQKRASAEEIARRVIFRGAQILLLGLLFRVQEFLIAWGWAPWSDLFRVDILNTIGVSIILMGTICWLVLARMEARPPSPGLPRPARADANLSARTNLMGAAVLCSAVIATITPLLWTTWRLRFLPWQLETYINGVHNLGTPQPWLFPIFPWAGFGFAGLALGFLFLSDFARRWGGWIFVMAAIGGLVLICAAKFVDARRWHVYPVYDYWHTSPSFFTARVGFLLLLVLAAYVRCRWGLREHGFSPLIQLGRTSLLVYWVHIELVYGRFHLLPPHSQTIAGASAGLLIIFLAMLVLSLLRTGWQRHASDLPSVVRNFCRTARHALR
jgi:uncharacterized membrane protein